MSPVKATFVCADEFAIIGSLLEGSAMFDIVRFGLQPGLSHSRLSGLASRWGLSSLTNFAGFEACSGSYEG